MGLIDIIRRALDNNEVSKLKKKLARLEVEVTKQGKTFKSLTTTLDTHSRLSRFEYVLSDGTIFKKTSSKKTKKPCNRITPVEKCPTDDDPTKVYEKPSTRTLVGRSYDYDEKSVWVEEYEPGVQVFLVLRRDGNVDVQKFTWSDKLSMPKRTIWWIENKEKVCNRFNITATRPLEGPLISLWTHYPEKNSA